MGITKTIQLEEISSDYDENRCSDCGKLLKKVEKDSGTGLCFSCYEKHND